MSVFKFLGLFLVFAIVLGIIVYLYFSNKRFDTKIIILSNRAGGAIKVFFDRGAFIKNKDKVEQFKFKRRRLTVNPPDLSYLISSNKGNYIFYREISDTKLEPIKVNFGDNIVFTPNNNNVDFWASLQHKDIKSTFGMSDWLKQLAPYAIFTVIAVLCIVLIYLTIKQVGDLVPALQAIANALKNTASAAGGAPY